MNPHEYQQRERDVYVLIDELRQEVERLNKEIALLKFVSGLRIPQSTPWTVTWTCLKEDNNDA